MLVGFCMESVEVWCANIVMLIVGLYRAACDKDVGKNSYIAPNACE